MFEFFHTILTQPLLNLLTYFYNVIPGGDIGWSIIALTLLVRLVLFPSYQRQIKSQREMQKIQPQLEELKEKHKDNKEAQAKALMEFYRENKVNPLSSCLPLLLQLPILLALYRVFLVSLGDNGVAGELYSFVADPGRINTVFLGLVNLSERSVVLALLAGAFQFVQSRMLTPRTAGGKQGGGDMAAMMSKQMVYFFPIITVVISLSLPSGLALYWIVSTLFAIGQQFYIMKR